MRSGSFSVASRVPVEAVIGLSPVARTSSCQTTNEIPTIVASKRLPHRHADGVPDALLDYELRRLCIVQSVQRCGDLARRARQVETPPSF
jgi:hypothetical protein